MHPARGLIMLLFSLTAGAGCSGTERSAGDEPDAPTELTVDFEPIVAFPYDADADGIALGRLAGATRLTNGTIAILDRPNDRRLISDSTGRLIRQIGQQGSGPGEFTGANFLGQCQPDTLFVYDGAQDRMSVFDSSGRYLRQFQPPGPPTLVASCGGSGTLAILFNRHGFIPPSADAPLEYMDALLVTESSDSVGGVARVPFARNRPLTTITQFALDNDRLMIGTADSGQVWVYDHGGQAQFRLELGVTPRRSTAHHYAQVIEQLVASVTEPSEADREMASVIRSMMTAMPRPQFLPVYSKLLLDPAGVLWAVTSTPGDSVTELRGVSREGRQLGVVHLPAGLEVYEVGLEYILAGTPDTAEESRVLMFRLRRGTQ